MAAAVLLPCLLVAVALSLPCTAVVDTSQLRCQVCRRLVEDIRRNVSSVDPARVVQASGFRLDGRGDRTGRTVPLARSQVYLAEVMESVCAKMEDYVRATFKRNGTLTVMPLMVDGKMNPLMDEVDVVQDADLNKSLQYYCDDIVDDIQDDLVSIIKSGDDDNAVHSVCTKITRLCPGEGTRAEL